MTFHLKLFSLAPLWCLIGDKVHCWRWGHTPFQRYGRGAIICVRCGDVLG